MPLRRSRLAQQPSSGLLRVTVELTVEIRQEDSLYALTDTERPATPLDPVRPLRLQSVSLQRWSTASASVDFNMQPRARTPFTEAALQTIAQNEIRNFQTVVTFPETPTGRTIFPVQNATRLIWADVGGLVMLGQQLLAKAKLKDHARAIPTEDMEIKISPQLWLQRLDPLKNVDAPLFFMLRDCLHPHTPQHILFRWNALRRHMSRTGQMLVHLIRQAEELPQRKWPPLVQELYFLLLE